MKKNLECKVTVKNGVRYYVDVSSNTCIDIICDDENAEEVCFDEGFDKVEIKLKSAGQLDNIKRIYIGKSIKLINIPNKVFPNVREVKSDNERYVSGTMLVEKRNYYTVSSDRLILLNSFCLREDEVLDLKGIAAIDENALTRCSAGTVINTEDVRRVDKAAFSRSNIPTRELPEEYNVSMVGTIITDVNTKPGFNTCVIPADTTLIAKNVFFRSNDVIDVRCKNSVFFRCRSYLWIYSNTLIFNAEDDIDENEFANLKECCVKVSPANKHYVDINGIIYTADMKHLVKCNQLDKGLRKVVIPDSVEKICKYAFYKDTSLESVEIPDSVKEIGECAFIGCRSISSLKLPDSIKKLGYRSLCGMNKLKELEIPGSVEDSNCYCELEGMTTAIKFGEGVSEVYLSSSCALTSYQSIPSNFIAAFVKAEKSSGTICINVHVDNAADMFDFVIPEYMSHHGFLTTAAAFDMLPGKKAVEILNEAYIFAISTTSRSITAFKVYKKTKDEKIKKAIQENYLLTALSIIAFMTEDDFMDFLKLVEVKYNKRILNGLLKKGWLPSISYILQNTKETEKEDFALS